MYFVIMVLYWATEDITAFPIARHSTSALNEDNSNHITEYYKAINKFTEIFVIHV